MDEFTKQDLDSICFVEKGTNDVVLMFQGFKHEASAHLFITFAMLCLGFDYEPNDKMPSKLIH
tara:strand:- start:306 stop:494 length:189 start_codon:yes stop_codon:yes gene_type:complete